MFLRNWLNPLSIAIVAVGLLPTQVSRGQEAAESSSEANGSKLIDFARDIHPIFSQKCLRCHGPEDAKNDFRVDDEESVLSYIEAGNAASSSLWSDYLITDDPDMRMPPASDKPEERLTGAELATLKLWLDEGASWGVVTSVESEPAPAEPPASLLVRIWQFQGLFHPASTHFPVALLTVSSGFVLLSFFRRETCEPVAYHCLWIGALGAIAAAAAGWSYAGHEGYGAGFSFDFEGSAIDRHRWLGIAVAVLATLLIPMAAHVRRTQDMGMRFMWLLGSLILMGAVGTVGYQGGELTYGEGHYEKEFARLFPELATSVEKSEADAAAIVEEAPAKQTANSAPSEEAAASGTQSATSADNTIAAEPNNAAEPNTADPSKAAESNTADPSKAEPETTAEPVSTAEPDSTAEPNNTAEPKNN